MLEDYILNEIIIKLWQVQKTNAYGFVSFKRKEKKGTPTFVQLISPG